MKRLLDENLSRRLVPTLQGAFEGTRRLEDVGLLGEPDAAVWAFAGCEGYALVSKDDDFRQLSRAARRTTQGLGAGHRQWW